MNHLDEGTIHAWLDGALDDAQSREIEAHLAGCATCAAAVAEARGFIAGASRILGALDDVPAGVIPMNAAAAPPINASAAPARTAARLKARGQWQSARWVTGIAAVLVGAVVLSTTHSANRSMEMPRAVSDVGFDSARPASAPRGEAARGAEPVAQPTAPPAAEPAPQRATRSTSLAAAPGSAATKSTGGATEAARIRDIASARNEEAKAEPGAAERVRAPAVAPEAGQLSGAVTGVRQTRDSTRMRRLGDQPVALSEVVVTSAPADAATLLSDTDVVRFAGCYRVEAGEMAQQRGVAGGVVGGVDRRRTAAAPRAAPAAAAPERAELSDRVAPLIRLDTTRVAGLRRALRTPADSVIGSWSVVGDSVFVDLGARGVVRLSPAERVECP